MSAERLSDIIDPALRGMGIRGRVREEQLREALADLVGPALASMCRAERLSRGVLVVATSNTALSHQLQMESPRLIAALNVSLGADVVKRLRFTTL
jgi:hypothetical protein